MNIGIIGTGKIGSALGKQWSDVGHTVFFGSRDADKGQELAAEIGGRAIGGSNQDAVEFGDVIVLALPWDAVKETLDGLNGLAGKVLIETTNYFKDDLPGTTTEEIAKWAKGGRVVKAFNTIFAQIIAMPQEDRLYRPSVFMAGDDADAKATTAQLVADAGFDPLDAGGAASAHHLEKLASFIIEMGYGRGMGTAINMHVGKVTK